MADHERKHAGVPAPYLWVALVLAVAVFLVYSPSLKSGLVYDAHKEIVEEGFCTSLTHLPDVLSFKVLGMKLILGDRPGNLLYLMLIAAVCGADPSGYHVASNLLHAANAALLFILLLRLLAGQRPDTSLGDGWKIAICAAAPTLIFALHPVAVEPVAGVSYSSDLQMTFFTLLALLLATAFGADFTWRALLIGGAGALCAFAAVTCKESGVAASGVLIVYWFLFRRHEAKGPWLLFLGVAGVTSLIFIIARFQMAPPDEPPLTFLGGSRFQAILLQPTLWVFMMGKLIWPMHLSADYTLDLVGISSPLAWVTVFAVVSLQAWLAWNSRIGALGMALFWLGLATVSNLMPMHCPLADRFYYLPLAGLAMELGAGLFLLVNRSGAFFWTATGAVFLVALPFLGLTLARQAVFASDLALWNDALEVDPNSAEAHDNMGLALAANGRITAAMAQYREALNILPDYAGAHTNLGLLLAQQGQIDEAILHYRKALEIAPSMPESHNDLGQLLLQKGRVDEAMAEFQKTISLSPNLAVAHNNLGVALFDKKLIPQAIAEFQEAIQLNPQYADAQENLAKVLPMITPGQP